MWVGLWVEDQRGVLPFRRGFATISIYAAYYGRREAILRRRAEQKQRTIEQRLRYNLSRWNQKLTGELDQRV